MSVLLRIKTRNDQSTAYACLKITILPEYTGKYDMISYYIIFTQNCESRWKILALVLIPEILAAAVEASGVRL